jgi:hypothetical protein
LQTKLNIAWEKPVLDAGFPPSTLRFVVAAHVSRGSISFHVIEERHRGDDQRPAAALESVAESSSSS